MAADDRHRPGDAVTPVDRGRGAVAWLASGTFSVFTSELLIAKVPSRSPTRAQDVPSLFCVPMVNVCVALLSGELAKSMTSCGFSNPCWAVVGPSQRTARKFDSVLRSVCRFVWLMSPVPFNQCHCFP